MPSGRHAREPLGATCEDDACELPRPHWHRPADVPAGKGPNRKRPGGGPAAVLAESVRAGGRTRGPRSTGAQ